MPFQPFDYANIQPQGTPWLRDLVDNLASGYKAGQLPGKLSRDADKENLANAMSAMLNQEQDQKFKSDMATAKSTQNSNNAYASNLNAMTPLDATKQDLANKMYNKLTQSQIDTNEANANWKNNGGPGGGVDMKNETKVDYLMDRDNPNLTPAQRIEAHNAVRNGDNRLSDNTPLNISQETLDLLGFIAKRKTTSALLTQNVAAQKAGAELPVLSDYIKKGQTPYSSSVFGISPQYAKDAFSGDKDAQERLAQYDASKVLQADQAAIQNKLNSGQSTATITREILERYPKGIKTTVGVRNQYYTNEFPRFINEALEKGFQARQAVPIDGFNGSRTAPNNSNNNSQNTGVTRVYKQGKSYLIPNDQVKAALADGGSLNG